MMSPDKTHDPQRQSWVESANRTDGDFPIQNLPVCRFHKGRGHKSRLGVGIGSQILDLNACCELEVIPEKMRDALSAGWMNGLMGWAPDWRRELRELVGDILSADTTEDRGRLGAALVSQSDTDLLVPCRIGDYTDFYASLFHATNVGSMFRPNNPLLPNYKHIPIGYHGRASSIVASGAEVRRPVGQKAPKAEGDSPTRGPANLLDYEMEVGVFVAQGNALGTSIPIEHAEQYLFGLCLLNDWSARDLQKWEYQPLGPFLAKSFSTSVSPWVVTMEALAPFRCAELSRSDGDPTPLDYLSSNSNSASGGIDVRLEVSLSSQNMRETGMEPQRLSAASFRKMYWTLAQMLTHHASNGCNLQPGDLLGSGTVSGPDRSERGSLLELTWNGDANNPLPGTDRTPLVLPTGEERTFLADGDEVIMRGYCESESHRRIGFGECRGIVVSAAEE